MESTKNIMHCYDSTAGPYANKFIDELAHKHLDRILLHAFAKENNAKGPMIDLGCGPGQTTAFLYNSGIRHIIGTDLSGQMITQARAINPQIKFETADMLQLHYEDEAFAAAVAFYAIVHFDEEALSAAFKQIARILKPKAELLLSYHVGDGVVHLDTFLDKPVNIDFYMWRTDRVLDHASNAGFSIVDVIERQPYPDVEYLSTRAYLWLRKD